MDARILIGFPLRRCSWSFRPIVPAQPTRSMIRWLDAVCVRPQAETFETFAKILAIVHVAPDEIENPDESASRALAPRARFVKHGSAIAVNPLSSA
jgi:hypothetical protein